MANLPKKLSIDMMQTRWASQLDPILSIPMLSGLQLTNVPLVAGINVINHLLGRKQQGWIVTDNSTGDINLYRTAAFNELTLSLNSDAIAIISLWVY